MCSIRHQSVSLLFHVYTLFAACISICASSHRGGRECGDAVDHGRGPVMAQGAKHRLHCRHRQRLVDVHLWGNILEQEEVRQRSGNGVMCLILDIKPGTCATSTTPPRRANKHIQSPHVCHSTKDQEPCTATVGKHPSYSAMHHYLEVRAFNHGRGKRIVLAQKLKHAEDGCLGVASL